MLSELTVQAFVLFYTSFRVVKILIDMKSEYVERIELIIYLKGMKTLPQDIHC